jgi:hypothetical protein
MIVVLHNNEALKILQMFKIIVLESIFIVMIYEGLSSIPEQLLELSGLTSCCWPNA